MYDPSFAPDPDALARMRSVHDGAAPAWAAPTKARGGGAAGAPPRSAASAPPVVGAPSRAAAPSAPSYASRDAPATPLCGSPGGHRLSPASRTAQALALFADHEDTVLERVRAAAELVRPDGVESLLVPRQAVGRIIGKKGATIRELEKRSGARIQINQNSGDDVAEVLITGADAAARATALAAVEDVVSRGRYPPPRRGAEEP